MQRPSNVQAAHLCFDRAIEIAQKQNAKSLELREAMLYAAAEYGEGQVMILPEGAIQRGVEFNAASFETDKYLTGPDLSK